MAKAPFSREDEFKLHALNLAIKFHEYDRFGSEGPRDFAPIVETATKFEQYLLSVITEDMDAEGVQQ
jgi:hypothetical protein